MKPRPVGAPRPETSLENRVTTFGWSEASVEVSLALGLALSALSVRRNQHLLHCHPRTRAELPRLVHPRHASLGKHLLHEPVTPGDREGCPAQVAGSAARGGGTLLYAAGEPNILERLAHAVEHGDSTAPTKLRDTQKSCSQISPKGPRYLLAPGRPTLRWNVSAVADSRLPCFTERHRGIRSFKSGHARAPARGPLRFGQQRPCYSFRSLPAFAWLAQLEIRAGGPLSQTIPNP